MNVVRRIEDTPKGEQDRPLKLVKIVDCGVLQPGEPDGVLPPQDGDVYEDYPSDMPQTEPLALLDMAVAIKALGNSAFKQAKLQLALDKYAKSIRYLDAVHPTPEDLDELTMEQKKSFFQTKVSCLLNSAMASF